MVTDKERLSTLETHIAYIKKTVDCINIKVDDLTAFKFKVLGASSVIAGLIAYITSLITG